MIDSLVKNDRPVKQWLNPSMSGVRQFDTDQALERALERFWAKGYAATSMQDLAEATGVLRGSLYNAYKDKEGLFLAAYARYGERLLAEAQRALSAPRAEDALANFFNWAIQSMTTGTPARGCLTTKTATDFTADTPRIRAALAQFLEALEATVARRLREPQAQGVLSVPPADAAKLVVAMSRGLVVMERVHQDRRKLRAYVKPLLKALFKAAA
jgi:AcrR family transcriptional regulator